VNVSTMTTNSTHQIGNILIVDDDHDFADSLEEYLGNFGYRIRTEYNLKSAEHAVEEFHPQVVLVDVRLGHSRGIDLISMIKEPSPELLFIVMTAYADTDTAIEALQQGAYDYLRKPLNLEVLTSTLDRCFRNLQLQREKEEALTLLKINEERFRRLIEGSVLGIMIHDGMTPLFLNQSFASIFGYASKDELENLTTLDGLFFHGQPERIPWKGGLPPAGSPAGAPLELIGLRKDGREIQIEAISQEIEWEGKTVTQTSLVDITHRNQLEAQLRQAQKMEAVGQLAGGVAHDINNMLQIIRGYTEVAMAKSKDHPDAHPHLKKVLNAADNASKLTRQLLAFSRREVLKPKALAINSLIKNLMDMLHRLLGEDISLSILADDGLPPVMADKGMIQQVLVNLCMNARDAMPNGGALTIETKLLVVDQAFRENHGWADLPEYLSISVSDSGAGIENELMARIFEPFFTTKEATKGTGLGLSMAYGIIHQHKGAIEVESEPGVGSKFTVYLPPSGASPEEEEPTIEREVSGGKETILFAEDQEEVLALMQGLLEQKGYRVFTALNGEEALKVFSENERQFDLVILDMVMPKLSGRSVFEKIRAKNLSLPVIFSTGFSSNQLDEEFIQNNEFKLLRKPYSPDDLYRAVREALEG